MYDMYHNVAKFLLIFRNNSRPLEKKSRFEIIGYSKKNIGKIGIE